MLYRDVVGKAQYSCLQTVMEVMKTTVQLMALHPVYTPYLLELLELMGDLVVSMKSALQRWLSHTSLIWTEIQLWYEF